MRVSHIGAAPTGCMAEVGCMDSETHELAVVHGDSEIVDQ